MQTSDHDFQATIPLRLPYRAFLPDGYDKKLGSADYPLIICLHGAGARGEDLAQVAELGLAYKLARGDALPFVVIAPQCPRNLDWSMILPALDALVLHLLETFRVDPDRVYLTGLSMGGFGVWALATEYPKHFAAVAPICGGGRRLLDFPNRLRNIVHLPVWCFHGDRDEEIPVVETLKLIEALKSYGGDVRCSVYPGVGHDSWTQTYNNPELYRWFLSHRRIRTRSQP
jgi:predicted peptidase